MPRKSLQFRIVIFFVSLLAVLQTVAFVLVSAANLRISRETAVRELETGERVFRRLLEQNGKQLGLATRVLAADFAFREAIATRDSETILSALRNHGSRVNAQVVMLSDLDNRMLVDSLHPDRPNGVYPFTRLLDQERQSSAIAPIDGKLYQLVAAPVRAPVTVAWVTMGFAVDDTLANDLKALSASQVSFLGQNSQGWQLFASTLNKPQRVNLLQNLQSGQSNPRWTLDGEPYETRLVKLTEGSTPVQVVLARSLRETMAGYYALQGTLVVLLVVGVALCLFGAVKIARRITQPLRQLAAVAERIQSGNYAQRLTLGDQSEIGQLAGSLSHMQDAIAERETQITRLAFKDALTDLPNRTRFNQLLEAGLQQARASNLPLSVLLIDLDRFQQINDTLGHPVGDRVLVEVARRLTGVASPQAVVARLSGDEFALMLPGLGVDQALAAMQNIQQVFDSHFVLDDGQRLDLRASMGAACFPQHGDDATDLIRCADLSMYRAKRLNLGCSVHDPSHQIFRQEHLSLLGDLRHAIEHDELVIYYQPKVDLHDRITREAEALVRWIHPVRGFIPPGDFIPFAEQTGSIGDITRWVVTASIRQAGLWARAGTPVKLSVNLATRDLLDPKLPQFIARQLAEADLDPALLCFEITESGFMEDPTHALDVLKTLRGMGLGLAIDDYGTGYSSLAYVRQLPVTELKIDRAFIMEVDRCDADAQIVQSTVELGHRLGLKVVAEGIETEAVAEALARMGCDLGQGYLFSRPLPTDRFSDWLAAQAKPVQA